MRLHRFFINQNIGQSQFVTVPSVELLHQLQHVFRFDIGTNVILNDGSEFDHLSSIESFGKDSVTFSILKSVKNINVPSREVYLFVSLTKKDTFEWVIQKASEIGVSRIIPIISERSEKKSINFERAKKIIIEASEQSGRAVLPRLYEVMTLDSALSQYDIPCVTLHTEAEQYTDKDFGTGVVGAYIGPEGGWSDRELEMFRNKNIKIVSLGKTVLRSETACIAILALLLLK
jgi:16S rRNA (uracil1498-N3)-methyltransferase